MKRFNVAVVGCGNVSEMHFEAYTAHPERIRLVACCDPVAERVELIRRKYGVEQGFATLQEMIAQADWEVAVVCTPTSIRQETISILAAAGKHVFCEKPMADNYQEAEQIVTTCERANVTLAVNQNFRYHYPFETARQIVEAGQIGNVVSILHQDLMFRQDAGWRLQMPRHALSVMGVHWFDGFRWMLGAEATSLVAQTHSSPAIECAGDTDAAVQVRFDQGTMVSYVESFSSAFRRVETLLIGEQGTLVLNYEGAALYDREHRSTPRERWDNPNAGANKPKATFVGIDILLTALENGTQPSNSGRDNLKTISLLDAAYRSAEEQRSVTFEAGVPA
ncbi:MAG TPA: Gfo/Idh/MocA family oxidoreductase [Herpetosiphonaceae bacterium]|nr:Gfo/Idh/MocA family oxidoreductase [Herpetosiphonaceae bacterium]